MGLGIQLGIAVLLAVASFAGGVKWQVGIVAKRDLKAVQDNARVAILRADKVDKAAATHEVVKEILRTEFVPITQEVERVVTKIEYRDRACLDDDGLRVARAAIAAANRAAGFPAPAVSAPARSP